MLLALDAYENPALTNEDKADIFCELIVKHAPRGAEKRTQLVSDVLQAFVMRDSPSSDNVRAFDFAQDADYIYAAFWQTYKMDLLKERGRLDWRRFYALFLGLPENTRLSEIMSIRTREMPKQNEYNEKEIEALKKAKRYYALKEIRKPARWDSEIIAQMDGMFAYYRGKAGEENG